MNDPEEIERIPRSRMPWLLLAGGVLVIVLVWVAPGVFKQNPEETTEHIIATFPDCNGTEIRKIAAKHNLQLVFDPCGSNNFLHFQWSPSGFELYYHTNQGPWLYNAETEEHRALPVGFPMGNAVWFNDDLIAFPEKGVKSYNVDVYDIRKNIINITGLQQIAPNTLARGSGVDEVLFLAAEREKKDNVPDDAPPEKIYRLAANTGHVEVAFPWLTDPVEDYTYQPDEDLLAYRTPGYDGVIVAVGATGEERRRFEGKVRASLSSDGRFWAIEGPGEPIPVFNQRTEEDLQADAPEEPLDIPDYMEKEVQPPTLWFLDTRTNQTAQLPDVFGSRFQWYQPALYWGSFEMWGMENKEFNRDIVLTKLTPQLREAGFDIAAEDLVPDEDAADAEPERTTTIPTPPPAVEPASE